MNINLNNSNRSFKLRQGAKSAPVQKSSLKNYGGTRLAFRGEEKPSNSSSDLTQKKDEQTKKASIAKNAIKTAAVVAGVALAYKGGKKIINAPKKNATQNIDFNELKRQADGLLGKGFFDETLDKAGWSDTSKIKETTFLEDIGSTLLDIPGVVLDAANTIAHKFNIQTKPDGILGKRAKAQEAYEAKNLILNIVGQFDKSKGNEEEFAKAIAKNINHTNPNYRTRDERVLNRLSTGFVSAYYAGNDFYNISMLKKDDKEEAEKSAKSRRKQEMSRMALNAGISFFTYGALDKYIKNSKIGTIASAGVSALFAEIVSRLMSGTPLKPLTPEEAKIRAQKGKKEKLEKAPELKEQGAQKPQNFKGNIDSQNNIFKDFAKSDGTFAALDEMNKIEQKEEAKPKKKKSKFLKMLAGASMLFSAYYLLNNSSKTSGMIKDFYKKTGLSSLKKFVKTKKVEIDMDKLKTNLSDLQKATTKDGKNLAQELGSDKLLETFSDMMNTLEAKGKVQNGKLETTKDRFIIAALYNGFAKMGNTIATILSIPGRIAKFGIDKIAQANGKAPVQKAPNHVSSYTKSAVMLDKIIEQNKAKGAAETIKDITKNVQDVKAVELEMSDLASDCRTMVTAVSTFFFVNDYRNRVLLESEGKDIEGANAEVKERLAHKAFNFVFNGTLMNVFNKMFQPIINKSLIAAGAVAAMTEFCNENLIRKSICSPAKKMESKQAIIDYDEKQTNRKGLLGSYTKFFKKLTGKKSIVEKAGK